MKNDRPYGDRCIHISLGKKCPFCLKKVVSFAPFDTTECVLEILIKNNKIYWDDLFEV